MVLFYCIYLHFGKKCEHNGSLCLATHLEGPEAFVIYITAVY
jgi:hypothetical protein